MIHAVSAGPGVQKLSKINTEQGRGVNETSGLLNSVNVTASRWFSFLPSKGTGRGTQSDCFGEKISSEMMKNSACHSNRHSNRVDPGKLGRTSNQRTD